MSSNNNNTNNKNQHKFKRPDVSVRDKKLDTLNVQLKKVDQEVSLLRKQIDQFQINDKTSDARKNLQNQNKEIIKTQADLKNRRNTIHENIKQLDAQIRRKNNDIAEKIGKKNKYNTIADAKLRINEIDELIGTGDLSIVQEKLMIKEIQSLNKLMKDLSLVDPIKKSLDNDKTKITQLKEELTSLNSKELSNTFETNQKKLDDMHASSQSMYDKRQVLFNKRSALYKKRDEIYGQIRQIRNDFDNEFKAFRAKIENERQRREEDELLSKLIEEKDGKLGKLQEKLNHVKVPAFTYEIEAIENALVVLDPTYEKPKRTTTSVVDNKSDAALDTHHAVTKVENNDLVRVEKVQDLGHLNTAPSKSKKHKKKQQKQQKEADQGAFNKVDGKFSLEPTLIATLAELDVTVPISADDVTKSIEELKVKHEDFLTRQEEQTKINIETVETEIEQVKKAYDDKEVQIKEELEAKRAKEQAETTEEN
ncbi:similar to Saccharomyces cerevisiae YOR198C BFR1 Component of mRNP complexes associated with polyribosomes [Maudiozyma saulgeensis]|uniref:Similar to Saccharomyces cerevisiae YOR198C BFR1 Component of mRNP complexes associated with polyribosomes n=1 Tax=Maudiozyma saulgeensis TaxID=1789683 RepID=A0A1X7R250_9SACH|nr:similar to Saccharomyces cerevisiae YOR198C BFR1 Component of mRNP complexes associated with polyribosomes [Kazachstania saulgeensis]